MSLDSRNDELNKKIDETDLPNAVSTLIQDAHKRKRQVRLLFISISLDLLLTIGFGYLTFQNHQVATQSESNRTALIRSCNTTNEARANSREMWQNAIDILRPTADSPQGRAFVDSLQTKADKTFAPRDCSIVEE